MTHCGTLYIHVYESYCNSSSQSYVVLLDPYSDGAILSKSGTWTTLFYPTRFANLKDQKIYCYTIAITPTSRTLPASLSVNKTRNLNSLLLQRFGSKF